MPKALTVESYEDKLKPMLPRPQDSEFVRLMRISFDSETTGRVRESSALEEQAEFVYATSKAELDADRLDYLIRDSRMSHSIGTLHLTSRFFDVYSAFPSTSFLVSLYGGLFSSALYDMFKSRLEKERLSVSTGITVKEEQITIDPKKLEPNTFYLFSCRDEKYVARRTDKDVVEIYEVTE